MRAINFSRWLTAPSPPRFILPIVAYQLQGQVNASDRLILSKFLVAHRDEDIHDSVAKAAELVGFHGR